MTRAGVDLLLYLMDEAFQGPGIERTGESQSLLENLRNVTDDDWHTAPPGGARSIFEILRHVGECKYVYDNHAFGDATMRWDRPGSIPTIEFGAPHSDVVQWLKEGHRRLRAHVAALDDGELPRPRRANWGEMRETRWLISTLIQHDVYHAGEINHIRALLHGNDRWMWEEPVS